MPNTKWYSSTMGGAPTLSNAAGSIIGVLDACLLAGFGSVTLTSLSVASNVATLTVTAGHGFIDQQIIEIAGATPNELNGQWRFTRSSATTGTFAVTGLGNQAATGTITAKTPGLGWTKAFADTNKGAYRSNDIAASGSLLRIDDSATTMPRARGYVSMSDINTGVDPFPTDAQANGGSYFPKSNAATTRSWCLVGDKTGFYWSVRVDGDAWTTVFFGDLRSFFVGDGYRAALHGCASGGTTGYMGYLYGSVYDLIWMPRNHLAAAGPVRCAKRGTIQYSGYSTIYAYPSPFNGGVCAAAPAFVEHYGGELRAIMPGYIQFLNNCGGSLVPVTPLIGVDGFAAPILPLSDRYGGGFSTMIGVSLGDWP